MSAVLYSGLSLEQLKAFRSITENKNTFITGPAGTGKTELLKRCVKYWESLGDSFALLAPTGIAALQIEGRTIHSWFWLSPEDETPEVKAEDILTRIRKKSPFMYKAYMSRIQKLDHLVIDEISMVSVPLFHKLNDLLQVVLKSSAPFGGLQVIGVGDFYQLSPAAKSSKYLFEDPLFLQTYPSMIVLKKIFRQTDTTFTDLLNRMRDGSMTEEDHRLLESHVGLNVEHFGIVPTQIWSTNKDVDRLNDDKLSQIKMPEVRFQRYTNTFYEGHDETVEARTKFLEKFVKDSTIPETLVLKEPFSVDSKEYACQVMLTFNMDQAEGLVNGSRGVVIGFRKSTSAMQIPIESLKKIRPDGPNGYFIKDVEHPLVRFIGRDGKPKDILIPYVCWSRRNFEAKDRFKWPMFAVIWSLPLKLAWATTVHKSQGQSLDCILVSLDHSIFADGQAYVAVSRVRALEGLSLLRYERESVKVNEHVKHFYENLG
jgi:ATP-dependent DNA helicase PIF1